MGFNRAIQLKTYLLNDTEIDLDIQNLNCAEWPRVIEFINLRDLSSPDRMSGTKSNYLAKFHVSHCLQMGHRERGELKSLTRRCSPDTRMKKAR